MGAGNICLHLHGAFSSRLEGADPALRGVGRDDLSAVPSTGPFVVQLRQNYGRYGHHALSPRQFTYCTYADSKGLLPGGEEIVMSRVFFQSVSRKVPETAGMFKNTSSARYNAVLLVRYLGYAATGRDSTNMTVEVTVYQDHVNTNKVGPCIIPTGLEPTDMLLLCLHTASCLGRSLEHRR